MKTNDTILKALYSCTYKKEILKNPGDQCSAVNHTEKVPGIFESETACVEYTDDSQFNSIKSKLFDIPFDIRKTGIITLAL